MNDIYDIEIINKFIKSKKGDILDIECPECGCKMIVREGHSKFLGCTNYPKCNGKYALNTNSNINTSIKKEIVTNCFNDYIESDEKGFQSNFDVDDYEYNDCFGRF